MKLSIRMWFIPWIKLSWVIADVTEIQEQTVTMWTDFADGWSLQEFFPLSFFLLYRLTAAFDHLHALWLDTRKGCKALSALKSYLHYWARKQSIRLSLELKTYPLTVSKCQILCSLLMQVLSNFHIKLKQLYVLGDESIAFSSTINCVHWWRSTLFFHPTIFLILS